MKGSLISMVLFAGILYTYWEYVVYVIIVTIVVVSCVLILKIVGWIRKAGRNTQLRDVDTMDGLDFEAYVAQLLIGQGYSNVSLTEQYDYGVDIVAERDGVRWGVQTKRYSGPVKAEAVRQVVTGLRLYGCDRAMVVTNSTFSNVAKRLAEGNDCVLIDRTGLSSLERKYI